MQPGLEKCRTPEDHSRLPHRPHPRCANLLAASSSSSNFGSRYRGHNRDLGLCRVSGLRVSINMFRTYSAMRYTSCADREGVQISACWSALVCGVVTSGPELERNHNGVRKVLFALRIRVSLFPQPPFLANHSVNCKECGATSNKSYGCSAGRPHSSSTTTVVLVVSVAPLVLANMGVTDELSGLDRELSMYPVRAFNFKNAGTVVIEQVVTTVVPPEHDVP